MDGEPKRIILAVDLCSDSERALEYALGLAREHDSEIVLLHVIEPLPRGVARWYEPTRLLEQYAEDARLELDNLERKALASYPHCRSELHFGLAARIITARAKELKADLIIVSTHPRGWISELFLRTLPQKLVLRSSCPVLTIRCSDPLDAPTTKTCPDLVARAERASRRSTDSAASYANIAMSHCR